MSATEFMKVLESKDWKTIDSGLGKFFGTFTAAQKDCPAGPHHAKKHHHGKAKNQITDDDMCHKEISSFKSDLKKMMQSEHDHDQKALAMETAWIHNHAPVIEKACHLQGECMEKFGMVRSSALRLERVIDHGDWDKIDSAYKTFMETVNDSAKACGR